jgi:hypothetical protein
MSRNDVIELIGIVCVLLAAAVVVYGISVGCSVKKRRR